MRKNIKTGAVDARSEVVSVARCLQGITDPRRIKTFLDLVTACVASGQLQSAALGRQLPHERPVKERSEASGHHTCEPLSDKDNIKRVDRFLGNKHVHRVQLSLWEAAMRPSLEAAKELVILVDWTGGCVGSNLWTLSASLAGKGRATRIYETVVHKRSLDGREVVASFLDGLKRILPPNRRVVIVTDAGFRQPFFKAVRERGWHFVGRLRGRTFIGKCAKKMQRAKELVLDATSVPRLLSDYFVSKMNLAHCPTVVLFKAKPKGREDKSRKGTKKRGNHAKKYSSAAREGWLILSSLTDVCARKLVGIYALRMTCEQAFRDAKSPRFGLGLEQARTKDESRYAILCLIGAVAALILCRLGAAVRNTPWARSRQANTVKDRAVLSDFTLGCRFVASLVRRVSDLLVVARRGPVVSGALT